MTIICNFFKISVDLRGEIMQEIVINVRQFPIFHSEYIQNVFDYAALTDKEKKLYQKVQNALYRLTTVDVPDDLLEFFVDQKKFSPSLIHSISFQQLLKNIESNQVRTQISSQIPDFLDDSLLVHVPAKEEVITRLQKVSQLANYGPYPEFYYYQIPITENELFDLNSGVKKVKEEYLPYLPFLDLSKINFSSVDFRNMNFADTNIEKVDFNTAYQHSIAGANFQNVNLFGKQLENIDARNTNLCGTYLTVNSDTVMLDGAKMDSSVLLLANDRVIANPERQGYSLIKEKRNTKIHF